MLIGRVLKRHACSEKIAFLDLVGVSQDDNSQFSVFLQGADLLENFASCRVGDLLRILGEAADGSKPGWEDARRGVVAKSVSIVERWDADLAGPILLDWDMFRHSVMSDVPDYVIQCDHVALSRLSSFLPCQRFRESFTTLAGTQDRTLLVWSADPLFEAVVTSDEFLGPNIRRIYPLGSACHSHPNLEIVVSRCIENLPLGGKIRAQVFPKTMTEKVVRLVDQAICDPREFSHVFYVVFLDGNFFASLIQQSEISRKREPTKSICRAEAKLAEILVRRNWDLRGVSLAVDVGASPGGWSNHLAKIGVSKIIAVDRGDVICNSQNISHWRISGEEAAERLLKETVAFLCCDANISPSKTIDIFRRIRPSGGSS